jgi:hypothetical protein
MREVQIGDKSIRLRGSSLSLLYYQQEFGRDLVGDLSSMITSIVGTEVVKGGNFDASKFNVSAINFSAIDSVAILRLIWVLARTDAGKTGRFPSFEQWLAENEEISIFDDDLLSAVMEEAPKCFFRQKQTVVPASRGQHKK